MADLLNPPDIAPPKEAEQAIRAAIDAYNGSRDRVRTDARNRGLTYLALFAPLAIVVTLFVLSLGGADFELVMLMLGAALVAGGYVWTLAQRKAEKFSDDTRAEMLPKLFGFIENFQFRADAEPLSMRELPEDVLFGKHRTEHGDVVTGKHDGMVFEIAETHRETGGGRHSETIFRGVVFHCQMEKPFPGILVAGRPAGRIMRFLFGNERGGLGEVKSANGQLAEDYVFLTDNRKPALRLVNGPLEGFLLWLRQNWHGGVGEIVLTEREIFLLIPSSIDHFELPDLSRKLDYRQHVRPMTEQLWRILASGRLLRDILE